MSMIVTKDGLLRLAVKYLDGKEDLTHDEKEILLFGLYMESVAHDGIMHLAVQRRYTDFLVSGSTVFVAPGNEGR